MKDAWNRYTETEEPGIPVKAVHEAWPFNNRQKLIYQDLKAMWQLPYARRKEDIIDQTYEIII